ncbi:MAG: hypothetical protein ACKO69_06175, partial [Limnohabitans sp.]
MCHVILKSCTAQANAAVQWTAHEFSFSITVWATASVSVPKHWTDSQAAWKNRNSISPQIKVLGNESQICFGSSRGGCHQQKLGF